MKKVWNLLFESDVDDEIKEDWQVNLSFHFESRNKFHFKCLMESYIGGTRKVQSKDK